MTHRTVLRVGYVEARPWSYRAEQGVLGLDSTAVSLVARTMKCVIEYQARSPSELADGLLNDEFDLAIGGLLELRHPGIVSVVVPHATLLAGVDRIRSQCRRAFFPNVWWMRRCDFRLRYRVALTLFYWRVGFNARRGAGSEHRRSTLQRARTCWFRLRRHWQGNSSA